MALKVYLALLLATWTAGFTLYPPAEVNVAWAGTVALYLVLFWWMWWRSAGAWWVSLFFAVTGLIGSVVGVIRGVDPAVAWIVAAAGSGASLAALMQRSVRVWVHSSRRVRA